jgi:hypothetical protein
MILDIGRTTQVYGIQYFWVLLMTKLPDGRIVSFNLGDGMNSGYRGVDQSSEDFVTIDGEYYKLDITRMISPDNTNFVSDKTFTTAKEDALHQRSIKDNSCELHFKPVLSGDKAQNSMVDDGVNVGLIAFRQFLIYGNFSGKCQLTKKDGTKFDLEINHAYGFVEYVFSRW